MSATRFGLTWWGKRWIASLEALGAAYANRLPRGRTYARKGTVDDLVVRSGRVTAKVRGSRPAPYRVTLSIPAFTGKQWDAAVAALAGQVRQAAALLGGRMPDDVDEVLASAGLSLFPRPHELSTSCSCPDVANPCKHVAAVHYVLAQAFDGDPFLLPTLRGRGREALLEALRSARRGPAGPGGATETDSAHGTRGGGAEGGRRRGQRSSAGDKRPRRDRGDEGDEAVLVTSLSAATLFAATGDIAGIALHPRRAEGPTALLRRLGPPPLGPPTGTPQGEAPDDPQAALEEAVSRAATRAAMWLWSERDTDAEADLAGSDLAEGP